jgi:hypothetical protein
VGRCGGRRRNDCQGRGRATVLYRRTWDLSRLTAKLRQLPCERLDRSSLLIERRRELLDQPSRPPRRHPRRNWQHEWDRRDEQREEKEIHRPSTEA